jgi:MoaA/NifB/PqqE/SkfB family radical SAM enzyme
MRMPPNDPSRERPLDHPFPARPHRIYFALTNHCNRACPWCSTCSSPRGSTWLSVKQFADRLPRTGLFQVQLEGGEPTIHPQFWEFVHIAREHPGCMHLVLCTNGVVLPRSGSKLREWLLRMGAPLTIKLSFNHHLLDHDGGLLDLAALLHDLCSELGGERQVVINVRLRRGVEEDDRHVRDAIERAGLLPVANIFFLQRYGFASDEAGWEPPAPVWHDFTLVNPDGQTFGPDLIARSEAMREMT